ncbi:MAG: hypothetical protein KBA66_10205 [Leptospiraceae bacterium]|nr:hypothetical protein [Leptospiraceae bacterium]
MLSFFSILFTLIFVGIILMFFYTSEDKRLDKEKSRREEREDNFQGADPRKVYGKNWDKNIQRPRICPVCGTGLKKTEFLYAYMEDSFGQNGRKPVHIYGCKFCYLGKVESDETKEIENISDTLDL